MPNLLKPADLNKLVDSGIVVAANVEFFHTLGLNMDIVKKNGKNTIVITSTDDEEGVLYSEAIPDRVNKLLVERQKKFKEIRAKKHKTRKKKVGFVQQELPA